MIVDASVAAKWYLSELGSDMALQLLDSEEERLLAPELIRIEVIAAITRKFRTGEITREKSLELYDIWIRALADEAVMLIPDEELLDDARDLALQLRHPFQDCLYLACARHAGQPLLTADAVFYRRAVETFPALTLLAGMQAN